MIAVLTSSAVVDVNCVRPIKALTAMLFSRNLMHTESSLRVLTSVDSSARMAIAGDERILDNKSVCNQSDMACKNSVALLCVRSV